MCRFFTDLLMFMRQESELKLWAGVRLGVILEMAILNIGLLVAAMSPLG